MASLTGKQKIVNALSSQLRLINGNSSGTAATATCTVSSGSIDAITLTSSGRGYETVPEVTVSGNASLRAIKNSGEDFITEIQIIDGGSGYTTAPTISIDTPPTFNSLLYQNVFKDFRYIQEVNDFPTIVMTTGRIDRDHQMGGVIYDQFLVNLRGYVMSENPTETCEDLAEDMERVINRLRDVKSDKGVRGIVESRVLEIRTDEGLFEPYGILDITAQIIYDYEALIDSGFLMLESGDGFLLTEGGDPIILEGAAGQNILVIEDGVGQLLDSSGRRI